MAAASRRRRSLSALRRRPRASVCVVCVVLALLATRLLRLSQRDAASFPFDAGRTFVVERVVDGDTLLLAGGWRIRLIGVDTPETTKPDVPPEPFGLEAAAFTRDQVQGRRVTLQFDRERRDRYHRILAYVFVDDWLLNEELIRAGYSRAETRFPYSARFKRRFRAAEDQARTARRGMWADLTDTDRN